MSDRTDRNEIPPAPVWPGMAWNLPFLMAILAVVYFCFEYAPRSWVHNWDRSHANALFLCLLILPLLDAIHYLRANGSKSGGWWLALGATVGLPGVYAGILFVDRHPNLTPLAVIAAIVLAMVYLTSVTKLVAANLRLPVVTLTISALLASFAVVSVFNYYKFSKSALYMVENMDVCYYYTNSKFFNELGYYELYPAMLVADAESNKRFATVRKFRNLHDYAIVDRQAYLTQQKTDSIKSAFTPERWEAFKHDVAYWQMHPPSNGWPYFFTDHGYNPPPSWTIVGGTLANWTPIEHVKSLCMLDVALMMAVFAAIAFTLGPEAMLFALFWYAVTFSGRWPMVATALLRHDWVAGLALSICLLAPSKRFTRTRAGLAGACMAYAACVRVFPAVFFFPYGVLFLRDTWHWWKHREQLYPVKHLYFIGGAAAVTAVIVLACLAAYGPSAIEQSKENLSLHAASYTSHRVGLGSALFYRGESTSEEVKTTGGIPGKQRQIENAKPVFYLMFLIMLAVIAWKVIRAKESIHENIHWMMIPLFFVTNMQINYYNMRIILVMWHAANLRQYRHKLGLMLLLLTEAATNAAYCLGWTRYAVTAVASICMAAYFALLIGILLFDIANSYRKSAELPGNSEDSPVCSQNV